MSYPINYPTPQNANVQVFYANTKNNNANPPIGQTWVKPQGASFVWFTLIGAGSNGDGTNGGGSGAVVNFMCPAFLIPDELNVIVPTGSIYLGNRVDTMVYYKTKNAEFLLLQAVSADGTNPGSAMVSNNFTAMGFFQSVVGASDAGTGVPSTTTFLSAGTSAATNQANYGYRGSSNGADPGFFQLQPIIVGLGGTWNQGRGGIGCGGGPNAGQDIGGHGLAVIITW